MSAPMIRLADRVRAHETRARIFDPISFDPTLVGTKDFGGNAEVLRNQFELIQGMLQTGTPVIVADNVADWYFTEAQRHGVGSSLDTTTLTLVPPFTDFWIEWALGAAARALAGPPPEVLAADRAHFYLPSFTGGLVMAEDLENPRDLLPIETGTDAYYEFVEGARWVLTIYPCALIERDLFIPHGIILVAMDAEGRQLRAQLSSPLGDQYMSLLTASADMFAGPIQMTLTFLNLKNVRLSDPGLPVPEKFARAHERKHDQPLVRYRTVQVQGGGTALAPLPGPGSGRVMPVHMVRGHMAEYGTDGRGLLFGRYAGKFFIHQHLRGKRSAGVSLHDYNVRPPKEKET